MEQTKCTLENMALNKNYWKNKNVLITGHTGFKGGWLCNMLIHFGAKVSGISLKPDNEKNIFVATKLNERIQQSIFCDICDFKEFQRIVDSTSPEVIFHCAAQPIVSESFSNPYLTFSTNALGTLNLMEICRSVSSLEALVVVTTDKVYENQEWPWPYRENDTLGANDPYSASKTCAEFITESYNRTFFSKEDVGVSTVRAGNIIGGGDWSKNRLIPDIVRHIFEKQKLIIRSPLGTRPWQHVLDPLTGYLILAQKMSKESDLFSSVWNFGPDVDSEKTVEWILKEVQRKSSKIIFETEKAATFKETASLTIDSSKAKSVLNWNSSWEAETALVKTMEWYDAFYCEKNMINFTLSQIEEYIVRHEQV